MIDILKKNYISKVYELNPLQGTPQKTRIKSLKYVIQLLILRIETYPPASWPKIRGNNGVWPWNRRKKENKY